METNKIKKAVASVLALLGISAGLIPFVSKEEGYGPKNAQGLYMAYPDPSPATGWRLPTICAGKTRGVYKGMTATKAQCDAYLAEDLAIATKDVVRCIKVPLSQGQMDSLISFNYNTGAVCGDMAKWVNTKSCKEAAKAFNEIPQKNKDGTIRMQDGKPVMRYTTGGGIVLRGLITRRAKERAMFEKDCE